MYKPLYLFLGLTLSLGTATIEWYGQQRGILLIPYGIVVPLALLLPRILYFSVSQIGAHFVTEWFVWIEKINLGFVALNAPASLWWHAQGLQYDRFLHFSVAALALPFMLFLLSPLLKPTEENQSRTLMISGAMATLGLFAWELYQYSADQIFGTMLFHDAAQAIAVDASEDILFGLLGVLTAASILRCYYSKIISSYCR